ncbi:Anaphase-promoting complex subunit 2 [Basidiobolus ranarum]|uniref:Anaphase-promoting complex subunit 2 n=1 Tax=Basidiobolus ranarum TaxID=34480 RepID=A0ABR2VTU5_9FUNG
MKLNAPWTTVDYQLDQLKIKRPENLQDIAEAWKFVIENVRPNDLLSSPKVASVQSGLEVALKLLHSCGLTGRLKEWYFGVVSSDFTQYISPSLSAWSKTSYTENDRVFDDTLLNAFMELTNVLVTRFELYYSGYRIISFNENDDQALAKMLRTKLNSILPSRFQKECVLFFRSWFETFRRYVRHRRRLGLGICLQWYGYDEKSPHMEHALSPQPSDAEDSDEEEESMSQFENSLDKSKKACDLLCILGLDQLIENITIPILHGEIEKIVTSKCKGEFDRPLLSIILKELSTVILPWLRLILASRKADNVAMSMDYIKCKTRLEYYMYKCFSDMRIDELFDIIVDYPDSEPALHDLKSCMLKVDSRSYLVSSLANSLRKRLLHPGANTSDIITQYVSSIKCLRILDPPGVLMQMIVDPIRKYLRCREDTIRCIISDLVDDTKNELLEELEQGDGIIIHASDDEDDDFSNMNWVPDPIDAGPNFKSARSRNADIISMLVNIYDTRDVFVKEFQTLLADRLLSVQEYDTEREVRHLELLKLRFGEVSLQSCEVMIKDITDSKRVDHAIHADGRFNENISTHATILSRLFWPNFRSEDVYLPTQFTEQLSAYESTFEKLKPSRKLIWLNHLGTVDLELELKDRTLSLNVSPAHAAIIWYFQEKDTWDLSELAQELQATPDNVKRKLMYWIGLGVIKENSSNVYSVIEEAEELPAELENIEETVSSSVQSAKEQQAEEMRIYWSYIVGMLTNLGTLPLDRVQSMLSMFVQAPNKYNRTAEELQDFLDLMIREDKLEFSLGMYKLKK